MLNETTRTLCRNLLTHLPSKGYLCLRKRYKIIIEYKSKKVSLLTDPPKYVKQGTIEDMQTKMPNSPHFK